MSRTRGSGCQRDCTVATENNVFVWSLSYSGRAPRGTPPPPWGASSWSLTVTVLLVMGETTPRDANSKQQMQKDAVTSGEAALVAFLDRHACAVDVHALLPRRPGPGPGRCLSEDTTRLALPHTGFPHTLPLVLHLVLSDGVWDPSTQTATYSGSIGPVFLSLAGRMSAERGPTCRGCGGHCGQAGGHT